MTTSATCRDCGAPLPTGSLGGFCPKCMLGLALDTSGRMKDAAISESPALENGDPQPENRMRDEIPGYRLLQEIGEGGCGVVFMADQEKPVHRKVAVKVIKIGMDTRQVVARFEAERQALARMDHPNIAKVLDAGATKSGRPYFTMELVGGRKITEYCDEHELTTTERLELFVQVCRAVQHAHQKGIIHRDIKPSNVLVAQHDGKAVPKVIDFGIAKATQGKLINQTLFTAFEQFIGTPMYMSPEQAEFGGLDVDTRSDIYSLGVLLYELLTGKTPFHLETTKASGIEAMRRTVVEKEPIKPSTRLSNLREEQLTQLARIRHIEASKLVKMLRGDLDWIVMKCLEKDRARRYETANGLAMDVERYLNEEAVLARPPSTVYRIKKFIHRNRLATLSAASISLTLIAATAVSTWQAIKATRAGHESQTAKHDATDKLWASYASEARARRTSREAGISFGSLAAIEKAAAIRPSPQLRNEAIAALVQADIRWTGSKPIKADLKGAAPDLLARNYAVCDAAGRVSVRRVSDDREVASLPAANSPANAVWFFSPNGQLLSVHYADDQMRVWDWAQSRCVLQVSRAQTADFSDNNQRLAVYAENGLEVFALSPGDEPKMEKTATLGPQGGGGVIRLSPDGNGLVLCRGTDTNAVVFDVNSGKTRWTLPHEGGVHRAAWTPNGKFLATSCRDNLLHIWDLASGKQVKTLPSHQSLTLAFDPQGTLLVTSGWGGRTHLWDFVNGRELVSIYKEGAIIGVGADGRNLVEVAWNGSSLDYYEIAHPRGMRTLYVHEDTPNPPSGLACFSHDGKLLAFTTADGPVLWDAIEEVEVGALHDGSAGIIGFDSEDRDLVLADPEGLLLWPLSAVRSRIAAPKTQAHEMRGRSSLPAPVRVPEQIVGGGGVFSGDGEFLFLGGKNRCQILNTRTYKDSIFTGFHGGQRYTAANRDGSLVATGAWLSPEVKVWNRAGDLIHSFDTPDTTSVAFSPDGRFLVIGNLEQYSFWQVSSWTQTLTIAQEKGNDFVPMMAFSPNGEIFAGTHSRNIVRLHSAATGEVLADLEPPDPQMVTSISFSPDGSRLLAGEGYQATRLWDLQVLRSHLKKMGLDWEETPHSSSTRAPR